MKLGIISDYSGKIVNLDLGRIKLAESQGYDSVWTAAACGCMLTANGQTEALELIANEML